MSEKLKGSEHIFGRETIQLDQEFFPFKRFSQNELQPYEGYLYSEYRLLIKNFACMISFSAGNLPYNLAIEPFATGYTVDERDFDLEKRKKKLIENLRSEEIDPESPVEFDFTIYPNSLVDAGMATMNQEGETELTNEGKNLLSLLRMGVSANGRFEGRISSLDIRGLPSPEDGLTFVQFYPMDTGPLASDSPLTEGRVHYPEDTSVGPGHHILLPFDKKILDTVGMKFYLDRPLMEKERFK